MHIKPRYHKSLAQTPCLHLGFSSPNLAIIMLMVGAASPSHHTSRHPLNPSVRPSPPADLIDRGERSGGCYLGAVVDQVAAAPYICSCVAICAHIWMRSMRAHTLVPPSNYTAARVHPASACALGFYCPDVPFCRALYRHCFQDGASALPYGHIYSDGSLCNFCQQRSLKCFLIGVDSSQSPRRKHRWKITSNTWRVAHLKKIWSSNKQNKPQLPLSLMK